MMELRAQTDHQPAAVNPPAPSESGEQRQDVPYQWPRGPEAPTTVGEQRLQRALIGLVVVLSVAALALLWYMIARSTSAF